jgi:hypothetical protein
MTVRHVQEEEEMKRSQMKATIDRRDWVKPSRNMRVMLSRMGRLVSMVEARNARISELEAELAAERVRAKSRIKQKGEVAAA